MEFLANLWTYRIEPERGEPYEWLEDIAGIVHYHGQVAPFEIIDTTESRRILSPTYMRAYIYDHYDSKQCTRPTKEQLEREQQQQLSDGFQRFYDLNKSAKLWLG